MGIISAIRDNSLQTDASLLNMFGQVIDAMVSRLETVSRGRPHSSLSGKTPKQFVEVNSWTLLANDTN